MDWIKQNKFIAGFLGFVVVAGGAVGFLAFSAKSKFDDAYATYETKANELNGLQTQKPYPEEANVKKMLASQKEHQSLIDDLQKSLAKNQIPLKQITPEKFQDNMRESIRRVSAKAAERNVKVTADKFFLGFEAYQGVPPKPEIAPQLERLLEGIELAMNTLIDSGISEITDVKRDLLPEEAPATSSAASAPKGPAKPKVLATRNGFEVTFVSGELSFRSFVNKLISSKEQFYVPKAILVANQQDKGPSKIDATAGGGTVPGPDAGTPPAVPVPPTPPVPAAPGVPVPPAPNPTAPAGATANAPAAAPAVKKIVVGEEKLNVTARIDIVNFAEPSAK